MNTNIENNENIYDETENEKIEFRYAITTYGADYPVDSIVKRIKNKSIFVPPFQRKYVWKLPQASRFIESLILGLPVPGVFLSKERTSSKHLIIDGQQRLLTLYKFYQGMFDDKKEFILKGVHEDLEGKTYKMLSSDDQLKLDDCIIHSTIIKQDEPEEDDSSIYMIFERLNTGGTALTAQEIRACIFYGNFNEFLTEATNNIAWRRIFRTYNTRMKEEELILRFLSLLYDFREYKKPLKTFLNSFMKKNRNFNYINKEELTLIFEKTIEYIVNTLGDNAFRIVRGVNAAVFDAVMVGTAQGILTDSLINEEDYVKCYNELIEDEDFIKKVSSRTSDEDSVLTRINMAIEKFQA